MRLTKLKSITAAAVAAAALALAGAAWSADSHALTVSALVLSKSSCKFSASSSAITIAIDPASTAPASGAASIVFRCEGSAATANWSISHNSGLSGSSPAALLMRHVTDAGEFLAYSLSYPASGTAPKGVDQTISVTASVPPSSFQMALPGTYSDAVTLSLLP